MQEAYRAAEFDRNHASRDDYDRIATFVDDEIDLLPSEVPHEERNEIIRFLQLYFDDFRQNP